MNAENHISMYSQNIELYVRLAVKKISLFQMLWQTNQIMLQLSTHQENIVSYCMQLCNLVTIVSLVHIGAHTMQQCGIKYST